jgi:putative ATP-grasp target RiPP
MTQTPAPWGTQRMGPYAATTAIPQRTPVIDPETQIAVIVDEEGRRVELGAHGTSTSGLTPTTTTPGDGAAPGGANDSDATESYDPAHGEPGPRCHEGPVRLGAQALALRGAAGAGRPGPPVRRAASVVGRGRHPRVAAGRALRQPPVEQREVCASEIGDAVSVCPHMFQATVDKAFDARVTVVGDRVFGVRIDSPDLDWRHRQDQMTCTPVDVPESVAAAIAHALADQLEKGPRT